MKKNFFITGGTGFFGRAILRHLVKNNCTNNGIYNITILTRSPELFLEKFPEFLDIKWLSLVKGDIEIPATFPVAVGKYSHLIHLAADSTIGPSIEPLKRYDQIVSGTRNVLDFSVKNNIKTILFASTGGVYGQQPVNLKCIPENYHGMADPLNPKNSYSVAKRAAEHLCALYKYEYGLEIKIARCFAFVGVDLPLDAHFAIGNFIRDALNGKDIVINGDGTPIRSYLDQRDLAIWLLNILENGKGGEAYNVGSDYEVSITELAYRVKNLVAPNLNIIKRNVSIFSGDRSRYIPDISKAKNQLGLNVEISLDCAIKNTALNLQSNAKKC
jgi:dTDP-glucose 4,6-dehydratase